MWTRCFEYLRIPSWIKATCIVCICRSSWLLPLFHNHGHSNSLILFPWILEGTLLFRKSARPELSSYSKMTSRDRFPPIRAWISRVLFPPPVPCSRPVADSHLDPLIRREIPAIRQNASASEMYMDVLQTTGISSYLYDLDLWPL